MAENGSDPFQTPQTILLDTFIPGFSLLVGAVRKYLHVDISVYIPFILVGALLVVAVQYAKDYMYSYMEDYFMSTADIRVDDELYNMLMGWIASQKFAKSSRRFVANTNLNSRSWALWKWDSDDEEDDSHNDLDLLAEEELANAAILNNPKAKGKNKPLQYTPAFGTHFFWHKGRLFLFRRSENRGEGRYIPASEREEISVATFGRDPRALKQLLEQCRSEYVKSDEDKTLIYRGTFQAGSTEPKWTRCMSRVSRAFSTVVLDEKVKEELLADLRDYLHPYTRRWYSNRGIPYRRGYLLYGPPGTGKSSLSFAIAGFFKLKIYIVSLNSLSMNEENLGTLFADLPQRCVVLLEDIDTAGLTNTREDPAKAAADAKAIEDAKEGKPAESTPVPGAPPTPVANPLSGRISLSALLNVLDGVASQEGRVLIMTTNHVDKLDKALIRPGRVDMQVKFELADGPFSATLFRSIFATLEGDFPPTRAPSSGEATPVVQISTVSSKGKSNLKAGINKASGELELHHKAELEAKAEAKKEEEARIAKLADEFATKIPEKTFSPAEIQGYLLKHKRSAEAAIANAEEWVVKTIEEKKTERERKIKEAEEEANKAKEEEEKKKVEEAKEKEKAKEEEEKKKAEETKEKEKESVTKTEEKVVSKPLTNGTKTPVNGEVVETNGVVAG